MKRELMVASWKNRNRSVGFFYSTVGGGRKNMWISRERTRENHYHYMMKNYEI